MQNRHKIRSIRLVIAALVMALVPITWPGAAEAHPVCPAPVVTSDQPGILGSGPSAAFDGNDGSFFITGHQDWQYLQVDFGCVSTFSGLRRRMGDIIPSGLWWTVVYGGARDSQGESVRYSVDGVNWTAVEQSTSSGWDDKGNYAPHAWGTVEYGWSDELRLDTPVQARFVRFSWDGDNDVLNELDIDFDRAGPLNVSLSCMRQEPVCTARATGGHAGGYTFRFTTSGIGSPQQVNGPSTSTLSGFCTPGTPFTVGVTVTDSHGRSESATASDTCAGFPGGPIPF